MRLPHAHAAVEEQRVVRFRRLLGHGARSGMREFVGLADDKRIERVARVELMVAALKIQLCLFHAGDHRRRLDRFLLGAHVLHLHVRRADFMKDGLDDVAVSARQNLPEDGAGDLHIKGVPLGPVQPRRLEPSRVGVDADPGFHPIEKFVPGIHSFALAPHLSCSRHRKRKKTPGLFPQL